MTEEERRRLAVELADAERRVRQAFAAVQLDRESDAARAAYRAALEARDAAEAAAEFARVAGNSEVGSDES